MLLKKIKNWMLLKLPKIVKRTLTLVLVLLVFDILLAGLGATYLNETVAFFFRKSVIFIFSDLLFLEGAIIFTIGAFLEFAQSFSGTRPPEKPQNKQTTNRKKLHEQLMRPGSVMMIVGAAFIGLSIMIGALLA